MIASFNFSEDVYFYTDFFLFIHYTAFKDHQQNIRHQYFGDYKEY